MASSLDPGHRRVFPSRTILSLLAAGGLALTPLPAAAAPDEPATSAEAAALVAARAHDLEVLSERVNEAREQLSLQRSAAAQAADRMAAADADVAATRELIGAMARTAYTGGDLSALQAVLSSSSTGQVVERLGLLHTLANHNNDALATAEQAKAHAARARADADRATAEATAQLDRVATQQRELDQQIAVYRAQYDRLSAAEQRASRAAADRAAAQQRADEESRQSTGSEGAAPSAPAPSSAPAPAPAPQPGPAPAAAPSGAAQTAVATALAQVGKPYVWGAAGPDAFDCSGLTSYAYAAAGVSLPHSSSMQSGMGTPVSRAALQPGDLVFFYSPVSHVGMYIGNGQMVHASTYGEPVKVVGVDSMPGYNSARRIVG
jgi:cell wall-associated NlpC family hydrolase